jgi:SAM-dependent methyltransferase
MLQERTPGTTASPSECWTNGCAFFSYSLDLTPEAWTKLRLHTYHLTGDNYQSYLFGRPERWCRAWDRLVADLPDNLRLSEPVGGIGFPHAGRLISQDVVRFQHVIGTLHRHGVLKKLEAHAHPVTLEIGSGYGGLASHLHRILGRGTRVLVDLPETLLFSSNYLTLQHPEARIYLYHPDDAARALAELQTYDFVLLPNFRLELLASRQFDLALNVESLQEMTSAQVDLYLAFLVRNTQLFYSWNQEANPANRELGRLSDHLGRYFQLTAVPSPPPSLSARAKTAVRRLRAGLARLGLTRGRSKWTYPPLMEYLCRPL